MSLELFIQGKPIPQGSLNPMPYRKKNGKMGVNVFQKPALLEWREKIAETVKANNTKGIFYHKETPVIVFLRFKLLKPKTSKRDYPCCKGIDLDKAQRSVLDALTGIIYDDDCQVCYISATKSYVNSEDEQGVYLMINELTEDKY